MDTVENKKNSGPYIDGEFIVLHHKYGEDINYSVAIKPEKIIAIEEDISWGNKTNIYYGSESSHVLETFDEVMNIIKEFNNKKNGSN